MAMESRMTEGLFWGFSSSVLSHHVASALPLVVRMQVRLQVCYSAALLPNQFVSLSKPCLNYLVGSVVLSCMEMSSRFDRFYRVL